MLTVTTSYETLRYMQNNPREGITLILLQSSRLTQTTSVQTRLKGTRKTSFRHLPSNRSTWVLSTGGGVEGGGGGGTWYRPPPPTHVQYIYNRSHGTVGSRLPPC